MPRRQPVDIAGAFVHVNTRGNDRRRVYRDGIDYAAWLRILRRAVERFEWRCHAYCLMPNHFHLLLELIQPTLAAGMRHLNGSYAQRVNTRYDRTGHVFEGPYRAKPVESDEHFLGASRYIVLNPVRAGLCVDPADWPWSSFRATAGLERRPPYLVVDFTRGMFGNDPRRAAAAYRDFVAAAAMAPDLVAGQ